MKQRPKADPVASLRWSSRSGRFFSVPYFSHKFLRPTLPWSAARIVCWARVRLVPSRDRRIIVISNRGGCMCTWICRLSCSCWRARLHARCVRGVMHCAVVKAYAIATINTAYAEEDESKEKQEKIRIAKRNILVVLSSATRSSRGSGAFDEHRRHTHAKHAKSSRYPKICGSFDLLLRCVCVELRWEYVVEHKGMDYSSQCT